MHVNYFHSDNIANSTSTYGSKTVTKILQSFV